MSKSTLIAAGLLACLVAAGAGEAGSADTKLSARTGVVVTPRGFPNHDLNDMTDMFRLNAELGSFAVVRFDWSDANRTNAARVLSELATQKGLAVVLEISPFKANDIKGAKLEPPSELSSGSGLTSFSNPRISEPFIQAVLELAALKPAHLAVATDVNLAQMQEPGEFSAFAAVYEKLYPRIKQVSPKTQVFVTFQWDAMQRADPAAGRKLIGAFRPQLDVLAFTSAPRLRFERQGPSGIPGDYYARIADFGTGRAPVFLEVNWPSDGRSGESEQVSFIESLPGLTASLKPAMLAWTFLHDVKIMIFTVRAGLITSEGKQKPSFAAFRSLGGDRSPGLPVMAGAAAVGGAAAGTRPATVASRKPARFGVFTSRLDGSGVETLITNPDLEMTHPRVSPDGKRVVITRYHERGKDGKATEEGGYLNTEIMVINLDGTGEETIIAPKPGIISANGGWTPDGKSLTYISTDNPQRSPEIRVVNLETRKITRMPTPPGLKTTDPHWEGNQLVFPVKGEGADTLWIMNVDGSAARQITRHAQSRRKGAGGDFGDFDPRLSPDGSKVAYMRIYGGTGWRVMVLDLKTGEERLLTPPDVIEGIPNWSSDAKLLIYRHINLAKPREIGVYTMTPDGGDRRMVPLPRGYLYNHPSFFPRDGSSPKARIIFIGMEAPGL